MYSADDAPPPQTLQQPYLVERTQPKNNTCNLTIGERIVIMLLTQVPLVGTSRNRLAKAHYYANIEANRISRQVRRRR